MVITSETIEGIMQSLDGTTSTSKMVGLIESSKLTSMLQNFLESEKQTWIVKALKVSQKKVDDDTIGGYDRDCAVQWLIELTHKLSFCPETLANAINYLDRFLTAVKARPKYLRCISATCFFLAAKFNEEEHDVPNLEQFILQTGCGCSSAEIRRMEKIIIEKLHWELNPATPLDFLYVLYSLIAVHYPALLSCGGSQQPNIGPQLSIVTARIIQCMANNRMMSYRPSTVALALISLDLEMRTRDWLSMTFILQRLINVDNEELIRCRELQYQQLTTSMPVVDLQQVKAEFIAMATSPSQQHTPPPTHSEHANKMKNTDTGRPEDGSVVYVDYPH